jgi:hypothetical protein
MQALPAATVATTRVGCGDGAASWPRPRQPTRQQAERAATPSGEDEDDLPVLTEVVLPTPEVPAENSARLRETLAADLAERLDQQLQSEMLVLVEAALLTATDHLQNGIAATIAAVLRDFIEQNGQARPPPEEPARSPQATA